MVVIDGTVAAPADAVVAVVRQHVAASRGAACEKGHILIKGQITSRTFSLTAPRVLLLWRVYVSPYRHDSVVVVTSLDVGRRRHLQQ